MPVCFRSPILLALIALVFAFGHGHQTIERFHAHEHGTAPECRDEAGKRCAATGDAQAHAEADDHTRDDDPSATGHCHCCAHPSVTAVLHSPRIALRGWMRSCDWVRSADALAPEAPVLGIEHPPQITRG